MSEIAEFIGLVAIFYVIIQIVKAAYKRWVS